MNAPPDDIPPVSERAFTDMAKRFGAVKVVVTKATDTWICAASFDKPETAKRFSEILSQGGQNPVTGEPKHTVN